MTATRATIPHPHHVGPNYIACPRCRTALALGAAVQQRARCARCRRTVLVTRTTLYSAATQRIDSRRVQLLDLVLGAPAGQTSQLRLIADTNRAVQLGIGDDLALVQIGRSFVALHNLSRSRAIPLLPARLRLADRLLSGLLPLTGALAAALGLLLARALGAGSNRALALVTGLVLIAALWLARAVVQRYQRRRTDLVVPLGYATVAVAALLLALPAFLNHATLVAALVGGLFGVIGGRLRR